MSQGDQRTALLKAEIGRLEAEIVVLDRQWSQKHWLGLSVLVVIPLMLAHVAPLWIGIAVLAAPCLVATQAYLLYVRRAECRDLIAQAHIDLERVRRRAITGRASAPSTTPSTTPSTAPSTTPASPDPAARSDAPLHKPR